MSEVRTSKNCQILLRMSEEPKQIEQALEREANPSGHGRADKVYPMATVFIGLNKTLGSRYAVSHFDHKVTTFLLIFLNNKKIKINLYHL